MGKAERTRGSFAVLANDSVSGDATEGVTRAIQADRFKTETITANGSHKARRRKKRVRDNQTEFNGRNPVMTVKPPAETDRASCPISIPFSPGAKAMVPRYRVQGSALLKHDRPPAEGERAGSSEDDFMQTPSMSLDGEAVPSGELQFSEGEPSNGPAKTPPVPSNRPDVPDTNGQSSWETAGTGWPERPASSCRGRPLESPPFRDKAQDFMTPLRQLPSFDDVNRYQTPVSEPARSPQVGPSATPRMEEWEKEHSRLGIDQAAVAPVDGSVLRYLLREIGASRNLTDAPPSVWDPKRERVYNTMFHVPWRCELLLGIGFFVCLDSFLALFTVLPLRLLLLLGRCLIGWRHRRRLRADELCDLVRSVVLVLGVGLLLQADVSLIYHWIRGQAIIKLYVVYNVLEILDKLCQSFGADVLQVVFSMAERVASCPAERLLGESLRLLLDECIAITCFLAHALILMSQAVTLNVAINSHSNALLTLLVSNNFTEVKGNVFKRLATDNVHKMAYLDTVERFHIAACLLFVLVQNVIKGEASLAAFYKNAAMVVVCEVVVDLLKHAFVAKFNEIKPEAYSEFLQSLCRQTLESQSRNVHRTITFVPLSPACVVIRGLFPLFFAMLPKGPQWWQVLIGSLLLAISIALATLAKALLGIGLQSHARWYLLRCLRKRQVAQMHEHNA